MSSVAIDTTTSNPDRTDEQDQGTSTDAPDNALSATPEEQAAIDDYKADEAKVVDLAVATLDPKDMLKKYAKLGRAVIELAFKRKRAYKGWERQDFDKVCDQLSDLVKRRVPIKDVRMSLFARICLWVEAMKPLVPNVEKLSYFQVANKFVPTLAFDAVEMTGEIRKEWLTWVRVTVERQLGDEPLSMKELDASIKERKEEIERERLARSKKTAEEVLEAELKAANRKKVQERQAAQTKVLDSISKALAEGHADPTDIADVFGKAVKDADVDLAKVIGKLVAASEQEMPRKLVGFDPMTCNSDDCRMLAKAMFAAGKATEMRVLRDTLDAMIKIAAPTVLASEAA
jgi:hypothetical protein